jgi:hypothetical protein
VSLPLRELAASRRPHRPAVAGLRSAKSPSRRGRPGAPTIAYRADVGSGDAVAYKRKVWYTAPRGAAYEDHDFRGGVVVRGFAGSRPAWLAASTAALAAELTVSQLLANPAACAGQHVTVSGTAQYVRPRTSRKGND